MDQTKVEAIADAILDPHKKAQAERSEEIHAKQAFMAARAARQRRVGRLVGWLVLIRLSDPT